MSQLANANDTNSHITDAYLLTRAGTSSCNNRNSYCNANILSGNDDDGGGGDDYDDDVNNNNNLNNVCVSVILC